jgi:nucleoside-diphosphate-sugar epimerase
VFESVWGIRSEAGRPEWRSSVKALVVGGVGSTGTVIVDELLKRDYEVTILHRGVHEVDLPSHVEHIHADPHWRETIEEALAGKRFDLAVAIYGRLRYVAEALIGRTSRLISVGGALAVYKGWMRITDVNPWDSMEETPAPLDEEHPLCRAPGVDSFSNQVRDSEDVVMQAHRDGHYNATHFRYPILYGPHHLAPPEWPIIRRAREGRRRLLLPGGGTVLLSRGYAQNVAHALMLALEQPTVSAGQIYNICDEGLLSNREWVATLSEILNHEFELIEIPFSLLPKGFRASPSQLLYPYHRLMDIRKVREQLGYRNVVPVEKALERTVHWYLENPLSPGGEREQNLGDPFDYAYEDELIEIYEARCGEIRRGISGLSSAKVSWRHPYPHPQKRGDLR